MKKARSLSTLEVLAAKTSAYHTKPQKENNIPVEAAHVVPKRTRTVGSGPEDPFRRRLTCQDVDNSAQTVITIGRARNRSRTTASTRADFLHRRRATAPGTNDGWGGGSTVSTPGFGRGELIFGRRGCATRTTPRTGPCTESTAGVAGNAVECVIRCREGVRRFLRPGITHTLPPPEVREH